MIIPFLKNSNRRNKLMLHKVFISIILVHISKLNFVDANLSIRNHLIPLSKSIPTRNLLHFHSKLKSNVLCSTKTKKTKRKSSGTGFYYGLSDNFITIKPSKGFNKESQDATNQKPLDPISVQEILSDTLSEFRSTSEELRDTLAAIRQEMAELSRIQKNMLKQQQQTNQSDIDIEEDDNDNQSFELSPAALRRKQRKRRQVFDNLARDVEEWAHNLLFEQNDEEHNWKNIECSKLLKNKFNKDGKIKCFLKVKRH